MLKKLKDKLYYYFAERNWGVRREYGPYVDAHQEEHKKHRIRHWWMLVRLNWHYRVLRKSSFLSAEVEEEALRKQELEQVADNAFSAGIERIANAIRDPEVKVVSFDIFDTLLFRPVLTPADTFRLLENKLDIPNFHNMRVTAEAEARKYKPVYVQDITLDDIYNAYSKLFHTSVVETERLKNEELKIEYATLYVRKSAKYLFEQAKEAGKQIIIISDMYLSSDFLDKVLKKNGYEGYQHLYVSSETGVTKSSKLMYHQVLSDLAVQSIKPGEVLHIGDNKRADVDAAISTGMRALHLPKAADKRKACKQLKRMEGFILMDWMNSNNAMLYGILVNLYFDDPFIEFDKNSYFDGDPKKMGYWFAPLMIGFTKWLIERVEKNEIEQLLWVWRDGYLPAMLFEIMRPYFTDRPLPTEKLYLGRDLRLPFSALDKNGLFKTLVDTRFPPKSTVDDFIKNRLLNAGDTQQYDEILNIFLRHGYLNGETEIGSFEKYRGFIYELEPYYKENAKKKIVLYRNYIKQYIDCKKKIAIFDRSPRGRSSRFLNEYFGINSVCFSTEIYDSPKAKLDDSQASVEAYLEYGRYYINRMGGVWAQFFEILMSDRGPGFKDVTDNLDGTYSVQLNEPVEDERSQDIAMIQDAIVGFCNVFTKVLGEYIPYMVVDRHGIFDYSIEPLCVPHVKDAKLIAGIYPGNSNLAPTDETVFVAWYNKKFRRASGESGDKKKLRHYILDIGKVIVGKLGISDIVCVYYRQIKALYWNMKGNPIISVEKLQQITDRYIAYIKERDYPKVNIILLGTCPIERVPFIHELSRIDERFRLVFVAAGLEKAPVCDDFPCIDGPNIFAFGALNGHELKIKVPNEIKAAVKGKPYLNDFIARRVLSGYSESVSTVLAYEAERYFTALIEKVAPMALIIWNKWGNNCVIPEGIAKQKKIPVISVERGFLEGTIMISENGYGKDFINYNPKKFCSLPTTADEVQKAQMVIDFLGASHFNRRVQPINDISVQLRQRLNGECPNILLIGALDFENPAFPKNDESWNIYGSFFTTSEDAMTYISKLAKKNGWNLVYKPHPAMGRWGHSSTRYKNSTNVFYVNEADIYELIDIADVVVCMISGVSHIALTCDKPLVQLGYTPLKGKGCCYEPVDVDDIEAKIKEALRYGYTPEQKSAFVKHVAQVNKYYYFDDLAARPIRYGRTIEEASALLDTMIKEKGGNG